MHHLCVALVLHITNKSNFGFCCELDDECARELAGWYLHLVSLCHGQDMYFVAWRQMLPYSVGVPGVLSVQPDKNFLSENKDYGGLSLCLIKQKLCHIYLFVIFFNLILRSYITYSMSFLSFNFASLFKYCM